MLEKEEPKKDEESQLPKKEVEKPKNPLATEKSGTRGR